MRTAQLSDLELVDNLNAVCTLEPAWDRLGRSTGLESVGSAPYLESVASDQEAIEPLVIVVTENNGVTCVLPFAANSKPKHFIEGDFRMISVSQRDLQLIRFSIGRLDRQQAKQMLQ